MKLKIPLTGTVIKEGSVWGNGELTGDSNDPIRPINLDLGNVSWALIDIDLEKEEIEIEVQAEETVDEPTGETDSDGSPTFKTRNATPQEKASFLQYARHLIESHTKEELYAMSKCSRLKRPFKEKVK